MSLVTVSGKSFAAQLLAVIVGGYKFRDSRESLRTGGNLVAGKVPFDRFTRQLHRQLALDRKAREFPTRQHGA